MWAFFVFFVFVTANHQFTELPAGSGEPLSLFRYRENLGCSFVG
jgi:hypothetical protein